MIKLNKGDEDVNIKFFRKAILLIHGFAGGNYDYGSLGNDLELYNNFDVFTFTLPGHDKMVINKVTRSDWIDKAEYEIQKIIDNGYREIYVIGHSMGGVIASYLASKYKEVTKLVLAAPAFHYLAFNGDKVDVYKSIQKLPKLFKDYKPEEVLSRFFKIPIPTIREFMLLVEEHTKDVSNINSPTLIIWGDNDDIVPYDSILYVYNNLSSRSVSLTIVKSLTHDLFINNRYEEVRDLICCFLRSKAKDGKFTTKI